MIVNSVFNSANEQISHLNSFSLKEPKERTLQSRLRSCYSGLQNSNLTHSKSLLGDFTKTEKEKLLKMGFHNLESIHQTDKKTAKIALYLLKLFKSEGLNLIYDSEKKEVIAYDSSFFDMEKIRRKILENYKGNFFGENFPEFYMQDQTFYGRLNTLEPLNTPQIPMLPPGGIPRIIPGDFEMIQLSSTPNTLNKLQIPTLPLEWTQKLKETPKIIPGDFETIQLPSKASYSQKAFVENPLFKYTLEKYNVFRFLASLLKKSDFQAKYDHFLENITKEDWISSYTSDPRSLAYLSLVAFLEGHIKQEDLFVIHMVASALEESSDDEPVIFTVLKEKDARAFLVEAQYPPFAPIRFYTDKSQEELETIVDPKV